MSTVLSFTPLAWVSPIINAAWAMENGGSVGQIAWAYFGGEVAGAVAGGILGSGGGLPGALARGFVAGGINGGIASYAAGGSFLSGLEIGGYWGAGLSGAGWTWQNRATVFGSTAPSSNGVNGKQLYGEISGPLNVISWWDDPLTLTEGSTSESRSWYKPEGFFTYVDIKGGNNSVMASGNYYFDGKNNPDTSVLGLSNIAGKNVGLDLGAQWTGQPLANSLLDGHHFYEGETSPAVAFGSSTAGVFMTDKEISLYFAVAKFGGQNNMGLSFGAGLSFGNPWGADAVNRFYKGAQTVYDYTKYLPSF